MPKCILIVDDSSAVRKTVHSFLNESGFYVCGEAVDGYDAVPKAHELQPDLIVLDFAMPRMTGIEAAPILKKMLPDTPIVMLTSHYAALQDRSALPSHQPHRTAAAMEPRSGARWKLKPRCKVITERSFVLLLIQTPQVVSFPPYEL